MIGYRLRKLNKAKIASNTKNTVNGTNNGGRYTRPKITLEFRIIPMLKLIKVKE